VLEKMVPVVTKILSGSTCQILEAN
jgi:hypothetical protein